MRIMVDIFDIVLAVVISIILYELIKVGIIMSGNEIVREANMILNQVQV